MNNRTKKGLRIAFITLGSLVVLFFVAVALLVNFIFTSERITPVVNKMANQTLNAHVDIKKVDLTFFSTFPRFGLRMFDGSIVSKAFRDSAWQQTDSLLAFRKCVLVVNPIDYMLSSKLTVNRVVVDSATVYAFRDRAGLANWDVMPTDTTSVADTATSGKPDLSGGIEIRKVAFKRTNVIFDDRNTRVYTRIEKANLQLQASLQKERSLLNLEYQNQNLLFWQEGQLWANHMRTHLKTDVEVERATRKLTLRNAWLNVNGVELDVKGTLRRDSLPNIADSLQTDTLATDSMVKRSLLVDIAYSLHAPSLETVLHMIPESILKKEDVSTQGEVKLAGTIKGHYGNGQMPLATLKVQVNEASAHYAGLPYGIDKIEADFFGQLDPMRKQPSYLDLKIFHFQGAKSDILADARVDDLLGDPRLTLNTRSKLDLSALAQAFPLQPGILLSGQATADVNMKCRLSSLQKQDLGRILVSGKLDMKEVQITDTIHHFQFTSDASLNFTGKDVLAAQAEIRTMQLTSPQLLTTIKQLTADIKTTNPQDTTRIAEMQCKLNAALLKGQYADSLGWFCRKAAATVSLQPGKKNPAQPLIGLSLQTDSLFCRMGDMRMGMDKGGFGVKAERVRDSLWDPHGIIGFNRLIVRTPQLSLPIRIRKTKVTVGDRRIALDNMNIRIGRSQMKASGAVYNLYEAMKNNTRLRATLDVSSKNLDCTQLINALSFPTDTLMQEDAPVDTTAAMQLFVIPANWDFELQTDLKKVTYDKMTFEDVHGAVDIRNQAIHLKDLSMKSLEAQMRSTLVYRAREKEKGFAGFDFKMHGINIGKLVDVLPSLDTIVPMLRSFSGYVDFDVAAQAELDSNMNIKLPTLRSAMYIKGDSVVLMDGETFAEISKTLMFKNKKRNVFDSISVNLTVEDGNVTVYPFLLEIDRYKAAVGGTQGLDMNFDYHISILKSPLPFKAGVNISGNLDKMKIRVGKAKYKDAVTPVAIHRVDSLRMNMGQQIVQEFRKLMRREE